MDKDFSIAWKASKQPRKQRKYVYNMPLHLKGKLVSVHLSSDLRKKYGMRNIRAKKGDRVKVVRGQHAGKKGKIENVNLKDSRITMSGIEITKKDGTKSLYLFQPSNLIIEELDLSDKKRLKTNVKNKEAKSVTKGAKKVEEKKVETKPVEKPEIKVEKTETPKVEEPVKKEEVKVKETSKTEPVKKEKEEVKEQPKVEEKKTEVPKESKEDKK